MIMWLWHRIQLLLPFILVLQLYKAKKSLPTNVRTKTRKYKAVLITDNYGLLILAEEHRKGYGRQLVKEREELIKRMYAVDAAIADLSFMEKEEAVNNGEE